MENQNMPEDDIKQFKSNFYKNYHEVLVPALIGFESERKRSLALAIILTIVFILAGVVEIALEDKFLNNPKGDIGFGLIGLGIGMYWIMKKAFEGKIKNRIMGTVASCFGRMKWSEYYPKESLEIFRDAGLLSDFSSSNVDDVFTGIYKNVNLDVVEAEFNKNNGKNTVFKGVIIKLDMNKNFSGHTLLLEDKMFHKSPVPHLRHTELEDVKFEKKFDVFTNDEVEARYILTPSFMERLTNIRTAFHCDTVRCAFYNNKLIIAMPTYPTQDLFSIGSLIKPVSDAKQFQDLCNQFISILEIIDLLKLDKKAML